jgi:hypothetical protein
MSPKLSQGLRVQRSQQLLECRAGEEQLILNLRTEQYFGLNEQGAVIWRMTESPVEVQAVVEALLSEFEVGAEDCEKDLEEFVEEMIELGLLEIAADS